MPCARVGMEELEGRDQPSAVGLTAGVPGLLNMDAGRGLLGPGQHGILQPLAHSRGMAAEIRIDVFGSGTGSDSGTGGSGSTPPVLIPPPVVSPPVVVIPPIVVIVIEGPGTTNPTPSAGANSPSGSDHGTTPGTGTTTPTPTSGGGTHTTTPATGSTGPVGSSGFGIVPAATLFTGLTVTGPAAGATPASAQLPPSGSPGSTPGATTPDSSSGARASATDPAGNQIAPEQRALPNTVYVGGRTVNNDVVGEAAGAPAQAPMPRAVEDAPADVAPPPHAAPQSESTQSASDEAAVTAVEPLVTLVATSTDSFAAAADAAPAGEAQTPEYLIGSRWSWFAGAAVVLAGTYWAVRRSWLVRRLTARAKPSPLPKFFGPIYSTELAVDRA